MADGPQNITFVTMTQFKPDYKVEVAFQPILIETCLGDVLSKNGIKQLRVTETEKFAHVTFFFNCKREAAFEGEDRNMLDSYSDIKTHDQRPQMRAPEIAQEIIQDMESGDHQVIIANICNADMVGHTGNIPAAIKAAEAADHALARIIKVAKKNNWTLLITADHGNSDEMIDEKTGEILTSHSLNPVPFIVYSNNFTKINREHGSLIDIAPTILTMLDIEIPDDMTGESLV